MTTPTSICNDALDMLPAANITSLDDGTLQAAKCGRHYGAAVAEVMALAAWGVGVTRTTLAQITNDRGDEWRYAYAAPSGMAMPVAVIEANGEVDLTPQVQSAYDRSVRAQIPFAFYGSTLYTNQELARLDYVGAADVGHMPALMIKAIAAVLAAKIALPITKDERKKALREEDAQQAIQLAVAANFNRQPQEYGNDWLPDEVYARYGA